MTDSPTGNRYDNYLAQAQEWEFLSRDANADLDAKITRGELITLLYKTYIVSMNAGD